MTFYSAESEVEPPSYEEVVNVIKDLKNRKRQVEMEW